MTKNIVVCYDGTGHDHDDNSVIYRLYDDCVKDSKQVVLYDTGVGTQIRPLRALTGLAFGKGIRVNVKQGLKFIQDNYVRGDKVFLFGYSRGAYTALLLAHSLLSMPRGEASLKVPVEFLGAFDTVASLGLITGAELRTNELPDNVEKAYHLLAIDEYRKKFRPTIWSNPRAGVVQKWVEGSHANLGNGKNYLADMVEAARGFGLKSNAPRERYPNPIPDDGVIDTYKGFWKLWSKEVRKDAPRR